MGFTRGTASPCYFHHEGRNLHVVVNGDDFTCLGPKQDINWYEGELASRFEIKRRGHIGESDGCIPEIRILNRILRLTESGLRYEADPRHAEMLVRALDLQSSSSVLTPGVKEDNDATNYEANLIDEKDANVMMHSDVMDEPEIIAVIKAKKIDNRKIIFSDGHVEVRDICHTPKSMACTPNSSWQLGMVGDEFLTMRIPTLVGR